MTLRDQIEETKPKAEWRSAAGAFVVGAALAALATLDGRIGALDLSEVWKRAIFCGVIGTLSAVMTLVRPGRTSH